MSQHLRLLRAPALAAALVALATTLVATAGAAPSPRATLAGSVPSWATSANFKSAASTSDYVGFRVYLGWRNESQAVALAQAVSDPSSSSYGNYLSPGQFRQQFAPTQAQVAAVQNWLSSQGFSIDYTPTNNHYVEAEGTVAQAEAAFGATLNEYAYDGLTLRSPSAPLTIPASLAASVTGVIGLDQSQALVHPDHIVSDGAPSAGFRNAQPCSSYWGQQVATSLPKAYGR